MHRSVVLRLILMMWLPLSQASAEWPTGATSLGDLAQWPQEQWGSDPRSLIRIDGRLFFAAAHPASGQEVWVSDGTEEGTRLLKDINPGLGSSAAYPLLELDGRLIFKVASNPGSAGSLWVSDGTPHGTRPIDDGITYPRLDIDELLVFDGYAYLSGREDRFGSEVWRYSLQDDELVRVTDLVPGSGDSHPREFTIVAGRLLFNSEVGIQVIEPGLSDANPFEPPDADGLTLSLDDSVTEFNGFYYFAAFTPEYGGELWRTDGTAEGTSLVVDLWAGSSSSGPQSLVAYRERLYFVAQTSGSGRQLFVSDGTEEGTHALRHQLATQSRLEGVSLDYIESEPSQAIQFEALNPMPPEFAALKILLPQLDASRPGSTDTIPVEMSLTSASQLAIWPTEVGAVSVVDGVLYFAGSTAFGNYLLWRSDGTADGSELLEPPDNIDTPVFISLPFTLFEQQYTFGYTDETGYELWRIVDGKSVAPVGEFDPGYDWGFTGYYVDGGDAFITGSTPETGIELWQLDGSVESRRLYANVMPDDTADSSISLLAEVAESVYFTGPGDTPNDSALWRTDGTPDTTVRIREFEAETNADGVVKPVWAGPVAAINSTGVFSVEGDSGLSGSWAVSGNNVVKISEQQMGYGLPLDNLLLSAQGQNLWRTTGEVGSVSSIASINDEAHSVQYPLMRASDNYVWFFSSSLREGSGVWRSDGTPEGTFKAADVTDSDRYVQYWSLGSIRDDFYYITAEGGVRLWRTGLSGTTELAQLLENWFSNDFLVAGSAVFADKLVLTIKRPFGGATYLWVTDGTVSGTQLLGNIAKGPYYAGETLVATDHGVYFTGYDRIRGRTMWLTDGTKAGTGVAFDLEPGFDLLPLDSLTEHNGDLYFVGQTYSTGREIWRARGNSVEQMTELQPGSLSANPRNLSSSGGRLFFRAYVPGQGRELMILDQ